MRSAGSPIIHNYMHTCNHAIMYVKPSTINGAHSNEGSEVTLFSLAPKDPQMRSVGSPIIYNYILNI